MPAIIPHGKGRGSYLAVRIPLEFNLVMCERNQPDAIALLWVETETVVS